MGTELQLRKMKEVLGMDGGEVAQHCECTYCYQTIYLKMAKRVNFTLSIFYLNKK